MKAIVIICLFGLVLAVYNAQADAAVENVDDVSDSDESLPDVDSPEDVESDESPEDDDPEDIDSDESDESDEVVETRPPQ
ncbi:PREDICTED: pheromone-processing carboxypeptidase KEX1-like [Bactrocera latifrons]|uniref:pheromone-processing carboxypeptidase KEX1-like n=1 Tax=Bactrocera latifrons TaxID=174628 RepID=UPI0008DDE1F6|nr:PREDICTED: pheromone-processing carboxypeptidase KEX1-like [Bactrocera latifrons]